MKKLWKLLSCLVASLLMCTLAFSTVACGEEDNPDVVTWAIWNSGWGIDVQTKLAETWNEKYAPTYGFTVEIEQTASQTALAGDFSSGYSTHEIFSVPFHGDRGKEYCYKLNDLLNEVAQEGESKTIKEKFPSKVLDKYVQSNGDILYIPGQAAQNTGITYNHGLFVEVGTDVILGHEAGDYLPRTTGELIKLSNNPKFNNADHRAWVHFADAWNGYYPYVMEVWAAQHDGAAKWEQLLQLERDPAIGDAGAKARFLEKDGRYAMFEEISKMINQNKVQAASNSSNFTTQQTAFLDGQGMMMVNGNWLGAEMQKNDGYFDGEKFRFMPNPVISTIIHRTPTIGDDATLSKVVKCVDEQMTYDQAKAVVNGLSEADYNIVWEARNMRLVGGKASGNFIANYSLALENAKIFFKFIYSDEAGAIFRDIKHVDPMFAFADESYVTNYDYNSWDAWSKSVKSAWDPALCSYSPSLGCTASRVYDSTDTHGNVDIIKAFTSTNSADRQSWQQRWEYFENYVETSWVNWMAQ